MKVGLALGGGSVRGLAHIGVLKVLKKHDIEIGYIAGTSMGAAIGGLVAAGIEIEEVEDFILNLPSIHLVELGFKKRSFLGGDKTYMMLLEFLTRKNLNDLRIEDMPIPFEAITVDIKNGTPYIFKKGNLGTALRATTAVPGVFSPVPYEDRLLIDGGVLNNLPADIVRKSEMPFVIAVDVEKEYCIGEPKSMVDILNRSLQLMRMEMSQKNFKYADIVLRPDVGRYQAYDITKLEQCIKAGEQEAERKIDLIINLLKQKT